MQNLLVTSILVIMKENTTKVDFNIKFTIKVNFILQTSILFI